MSCVVVREKDAKKLEQSRVTGSLSEKAYVSQAIASPASKHMTAGYIRLEKGYAKEFESPIDEIDLFLEGTLTYTCEGKTFTAKKGDIVLIEKGSHVKFITEKGCFVFYVTYPLLQETIDVLKRQQEK